MSLIRLRLILRKGRAMYVAQALQLRDGDRGRLEALTRASTAPAGLVQRAWMVLLAADGVSSTEIAQLTHSSRPTVRADKGRPPAEFGVTHWSSRLLAARLGISFATVARIWRK